MHFRMKLRYRIAALTIAAGIGTLAAAQESSPFMLPDFKTPDNDCGGFAGFQRAKIQQKPSKVKDAYDVVLSDLSDFGGAKYAGDLAGLVFWEPDSTVTFNGTFTISACKSGETAPIVITGHRLKFRLNAEGRFVYLKGTGTVTQASTTTKLPIVAAAPVSSPDDKASAVEKPARAAKPSARPAPK